MGFDVNDVSSHGNAVTGNVTKVSVMTIAGRHLYYTTDRRAGVT